METQHRSRRLPPMLRSALLWIVSLAVTMACLRFQDKTGPTYPLEGAIHTAQGPVNYRFIRSETIGRDLAVVLRDPVPDGIRAMVSYRRYLSHDEWSWLPLERGSFESRRRGRAETLHGAGALLPSLAERAGKYEYFVHIEEDPGVWSSVTGSRAVVARYKGAVPMWALALHIVMIFASMCLAVRTVLETLVSGWPRALMRATVATLFVGGFVLGPLMQWYAFGVWWSGIPLGFDWTDNKVVVGMAGWIIALFKSRTTVNRRWVYVAGILTMLVYFIPHSVFGSEFDYRTGTGRGTAG